jgi:PleD family two-component response regulator
MKRHNVLIAGDDSRAREGLISLLATALEIEVVGEAAKRICSNIQRYILLSVQKIPTVDCLTVKGRIRANLEGNS